MNARHRLGIAALCAVGCGAVTGASAYAGDSTTTLTVRHLHHGCQKPNALRVHVTIKHALKHASYLLQAQLPSGGVGEVIFATTRHTTLRHIEHVTIDGSAPTTASTVTFHLYRHTTKKDFDLARGTTTGTLPACGK